MTGNNSPLIAVDGATGYLGNHLVARLRNSGLRVRCIVHPGARERDIDFLKSTGAEVCVASLKKPDGGVEGSLPLIKALEGVDVAVHLIGSIAPKKGERLQDLHGSQTANLVKTAKQAGVKKIVQVTALGTAADAKSTYHATKWQAEQHVQNSGLKWIILRPSLIIGKEVGNRDSKLVARYMELVRRRSKVPVIGGGNNRLQPVFVADLAQALEKSIVDSKYDNQIYEIGGDEIVSMRQFVERLMALQGVNKKITGVSTVAASFMAVICEKVQNVPLVSRDQVKLSTTDNVCSKNALHTAFGIEPKSIEEALSTYKAGSSGGVLESSGNRR